MDCFKFTPAVQKIPRLVFVLQGSSISGDFHIMYSEKDSNDMKPDLNTLTLMSSTVNCAFTSIYVLAFMLTTTLNMQTWWNHLILTRTS